MQIFTARVHGGIIVPEDGVTLPEGTKVTVVANADEATFSTTPDEERELLESIAEGERGEVISAEDLFERLRRQSRP